MVYATPIGTRVYQCIKLIQHLPRHVYEFGRYLRIRYNSQPTPTSTTTSENNASDNTPVPVNQQTTSETQPVTTQPTQPHNNKYVNKSNHTKTTIQEHVTKYYANTTIIRYTRRNTKHTQQQKTQEKPTQQIKQQPQKDNRQIQSTEQQPPNPEPQTITKTTTPQPTSTPTEKRTLSPEEQQSFLYWRGLVDVGGGSKKKRYKLYPNQLYRYIQDKPVELKRYFKKTEKETKHGTKPLYMKYKEEEDILQQQCRWNDMNNQM